jgi:hypothetical protein
MKRATALLLAALLMTGSSPRLVAQRVRRLPWEKIAIYNYVEDPVLKLMQALPELARLQASEDSEIPGLVLANVGERVDAFSRVIGNLTAREEVEQAQLFHDGDVREKQKSIFDYLILTRLAEGKQAFEEYRTDLKGKVAEQAGLEQHYTITWGFAATCLYFATLNQEGSTFRYLGTDMIDDTPVHVVAFAQRRGLARVTETIREGDLAETVFVQGIAWIGRDSYEIRRIRTDLEKPITNLGVMQQTTDVRFKEFRLEGIPTAQWLPADVTVTSTKYEDRFRNRHHYTNYRMFRVEAVIKPELEPKQD